MQYTSFCLKFILLGGYKTGTEKDMLTSMGKS